MSEVRDSQIGLHSRAGQDAYPSSNEVATRGCLRTTRHRTREDGFSSIQAMLILFALSLSVLGLGAGISLTKVYYQKNELVQQDLILLKTEVAEIIQQLESDPTPDSDSSMDPVWSYIEGKANDYEYIKLTDVSSRINPNWVRPVFFERTDLKKFLLKGVSSDMIKDHRNEKGFVLDIKSEYSELIDPDALDTLFTPYSYINVNTAYEYVLKDMYELVTGNPGRADTFHTFISNSLIEKHIITEEELINAAGSDYDSIYPVISTLPEMNVHFIPEFILKQVLSYPYGGEVIDNNSSIYSTLLSLRFNSEITNENLHELIETEGLQERVFDHLGTKTWFWKVEITTGKNQIEAIVVCVPPVKGGNTVNMMKYDYIYRLYSFTLMKP